jgi:hypothetical protein
MSSITEAAGLRNNLVFDGGNRDHCELYRTTAGQMFLWQNDGPANLAFLNTSFRITDPAATFSASLNMSLAQNVLVDRCRFTGTFPSATTDGIRHGCFLLGGSNIVVRNTEFNGTQLQACGLGRSVRGVAVYGNTFLNCNDLGVSVNSGDGSGLTLKDIHIHGNRFQGVYGAGFIYVGSDAVTTNPDSMSDVVIEDNVCSGTLSSQLAAGSRNAIIVAWCTANNRVHVRNNNVSNDNHTVDLTQVRGIYAFDRIGDMTGAEDVSFEGNSINYIVLTDQYEGLRVQGKALRGVRILRNDLGSESAGMAVIDASELEIAHNRVRNSRANALTLGTSNGNIDTINIHHNLFRTTAAFKSAILFTGTHNMTQMWIERNRLDSGQNSIIDATTGSPTRTWRYINNSHSTGLHASAVPTTDSGNITE